MIDYRHLIFRRKYGNVGFITLPSGVVSVLSVIFLFLFAAYNIINFLYAKYLTVSARGSLFGSSIPEVDFFHIPTSAIFFVTVLVYLAVFNSLFIGQKIKNGKLKPNINILLFLFMYSIIAPFWLIKAIYNAVRSYEVSWTSERDKRGI